MEILPQTSDCFACGKNHPSGLRLAFSLDGDAVTCIWNTQPHQSGFHGTVHGGLTATVLDEAMAWACGILAGRFAYSVEMTMRYHKILSPGMETVCRAELESKPSNRLIKTKATLTCAGELVASATGKYIPIRDFTEDDIRKEFDEGAEVILSYLA